MSIMDTGFVNDIKHSKYLYPKAYRCWHNMRHRCKRTKDNPTYNDVDICVEWRKFSTFLKWFNTMYVDDYELDKDLLGNGKIYSPVTCCFLPKELNIAIRHKQCNNSTSYYGISKKTNRDCYTIQLSMYGKKTHIGYAKTLEEAKEIYDKAKHTYVKELAETYYSLGKINAKVYEALIERRYE